MNALQMVNELLSRFGLAEVSAFSGTAGADSTVALRKLNIAQTMIATSYPFSWNDSTNNGEITTSQGTAVYNLSSANGRVSRLLAARHNYNGGGVIDIVDRPTLERYKPKRDATTDQDIPRYLTTYGKIFSSGAWHWQIEIFPIPDANFDGQRIFYFFQQEPTDLSSETDVSVIPIEFHPLLIDNAELLYRTGAVRVGGDQNQVDLFAMVASRVDEGMKRLVAADTSWGVKTQTWDIEQLPL